jgi:hypothetical protein
VALAMGLWWGTGTGVGVGMGMGWRLGRGIGGDWITGGGFAEGEGEDHSAYITSERDVVLLRLPDSISRLGV